MENGKFSKKQQTHKENYKFFQNRSCEYFPCHKEKIDEKSFNCLFCYCPLYALKEECGGNFMYIEGGIKDCSLCKIPHIKDIGYEHIQNKIKKMIEISKKS